MFGGPTLGNTLIVSSYDGEIILFLVKLYKTSVNNNDKKKKKEKVVRGFVRALWVSHKSSRAKDTDEGQGGIHANSFDVLRLDKIDQLLLK